RDRGTSVAGGRSCVSGSAPIPSLYRKQERAKHQAAAPARIPRVQERGVYTHHHVDLPAKGTRMTQPQTVELIPVAALSDRVRALRKAGYRLVQIGAVRLAAEVELTYSFDRAGALLSVRLLIPANDCRLPSISSIYGCAVLYENELHDLFQIEVEG